MNKQSFSVYLTDTQHEKIKKEARETGISMSSIVKNLINQHLSKGANEYEN